MSEERVPRLFTPEEYLLIEFDAPTRSEYDNSKIYAMAGASDVVKMKPGANERMASQMSRLAAM